MGKEILNKNVIDTKDNSDIKLLPLEVDYILGREVRIAEYYARNNICDIRVRNDYLSIAKLLEKISDGYFISPSENDDKFEPFFQQVFFIDYYYGDDTDFKQELKDNNIFPTFIIEHDKGGFVGDEHTAVLVYCLNEPTRDIELVNNIYKALCKKGVGDDEIISYNAYDYGPIKNLTVSNIVYVPVKGDSSYGD